MTKVASISEQQRYPLHVKAVPTLNIEYIYTLLSPLKAKRLNYLFSLLSTPTYTDAAQRTSPPRIQSDIHQLHQCGITERVQTFDPRIPAIIPFTVTEEKEFGTRRRFIAWPQCSNTLSVSAGYIAEVPLQHISGYLDALLTPYAFVTDLTTSFFEVALPPHCRNFFSFQDSKGTRWALTRLPVGHVVSPEMMQTITVALAGHPDYVMQSSLPASLLCDIWIDNIRYTGSQSEVMLGKDLFLRHARAANASHNTNETYHGTVYNFIGVTFNHRDHTVKLREKTIKKLQPLTQHITFAQLERLHSQLLFASSVLNVSQSLLYWAIKLIRRRLSQLSRRPSLLSAPVALPPTSFSQLSSWRSTIALNLARRITRPRSDRLTYTVFTDTS
eukprot:gene7028-4984_t